MSRSSTVGNYLKAIFQAQIDIGRHELVPMGPLASAMGVMPGTATTMVKALAESGLVKYDHTEAFGSRPPARSWLRWCSGVTA